MFSPPVKVRKNCLPLCAPKLSWSIQKYIDRIQLNSWLFYKANVVKFLLVVWFRFLSHSDKIKMHHGMGKSCCKNSRSIYIYNFKLWINYSKSGPDKTGLTRPVTLPLIEYHQHWHGRVSSYQLCYTVCGSVNLLNTQYMYYKWIFCCWKHSKIWHNIHKMDIK